MLRVVRRRAIVVLVSDFLVPAGQGVAVARALRRASSRHDVVAVRVVDPREEALPAVGLLQVVDAETGAATVVDTSSAAVRAAFAKRAASRSGAHRGDAQRIPRGPLTVRTDADYVEPLAAFFRKRSRRR